MLVVGSTAKLSNGKLTDIEVHAMFKDLDNDLYEEDFEKNLTQELERVRQEVLMYRSMAMEAHLQEASSD